MSWVERIIEDQESDGRVLEAVTDWVLNTESEEEIEDFFITRTAKRNYTLQIYE